MYTILWTVAEGKVPKPANYLQTLINNWTGLRLNFQPYRGK